MRASRLIDALSGTDKAGIDERECANFRDEALIFRDVVMLVSQLGIEGSHALEQPFFRRVRRG